MNKIGNFVASEMNSLISKNFGFHKQAKSEECCSACGKDCKCDSGCPCKGKCASACQPCSKIESKSYQEIFGIILNSSERLDSMGFEKTAQLLLQASNNLMQEVEDKNEAEEMMELNEVESDPELSRLFDEIKKDREDENQIEDRNYDWRSDELRPSRMIGENPIMDYYLSEAEEGRDPSDFVTGARDMPTLDDVIRKYEERKNKI